MKFVQKNYSLFVWYIFKTAAIKKKLLWFQSTLVQISLYSWLNGQYMLPYYSKKVFFLKFNAKKGGNLLNF